MFSFVAGAGGRKGKVSILICGHSMIFWAVHWAKRSSFGSQLGYRETATTEWVRRQGMRWPALLPLLLEERRVPPLQVLLVHLGGNDLGLIKGKKNFDNPGSERSGGTE